MVEAKTILAIRGNADSSRLNVNSSQSVQSCCQCPSRAIMYKGGKNVSVICGNRS